MQAAMLALAVVVGAVPDDASPEAVLPAEEATVVSAHAPLAWPLVLPRTRHWRRWPVPPDYFYRPFDYRHQFDYPWHARVRVAPGCVGPMNGPVAVPRLSSRTAESRRPVADERH